MGALAPDVDAVFMPFGWDIYLRVHEIGTHALVGTLPVALAVATIVRGRTREPLAPLFGVAWLAALSHIVLDVVSGARIRLGWPLVEARTLVPLVAMAEPWLIAGFGVSIVALVLAARRRRGAAQLVVGALAVFLGLKSLWLLQAVRTLAPSSASRVDARVIEARWFTLREWNVFESSATTLSHLVIAPGRSPTLVESWPRSDHEVPLVEQSRRLDTVRNLLALHELTFARERTDEQGNTDVLWSDIRFCWTPAALEPGAPRTGPLVLGPEPIRIACALWFGGTYDRAGRALIQRVQVFGRWQVRPMQP